MGSSAVRLGGIAIGGAFLRRQRRLADPLINLELCRIPTSFDLLKALIEKPHRVLSPDRS